VVADTTHSHDLSAALRSSCTITSIPSTPWWPSPDPGTDEHR